MLDQITNELKQEKGQHTAAPNAGRFNILRLSGTYKNEKPLEIQPETVSEGDRGDTSPVAFPYTVDFIHVVLELIHIHLCV